MSHTTHKKLKWTNKPDTIKLIEENIKKLLSIGVGNDFLDMIPKTNDKSKNQQMGLYKTQKLLLHT